MEDLQARLQSPDFRERVRALLTLRTATPEIVAPLAALTIQDTHVQMRSYTCMLLGKKPSETAFQLLVQTLQYDLDPGVRADAAGALGAIGDPRGYELLAHTYYEDTEWIVRYSALVSLGNLGDVRGFDLIASALNSENDLFSQAAIGALGELGDERAVPLLLPFVASEDWMIRQKIGMALGNIGGTKAQEVLRYLAKDPNDQVALTAGTILREAA